MSVYPTGLTNYFHPSQISDSESVTVLINYPIVLKSFVCGLVSDLDTNRGSVFYKLFDGDSEIFRIQSALDITSAASLNPRYSFSFPMNGIKVSTSLGISIKSSGYIPGIKGDGVSVLYQR